MLIHTLSRITEQKMADVVLEALPPIVARGVQFALLGRGEAELERRFLDVASSWPGQVAIRIGYEKPLAHRLQAGGDILLHPSRFEPCGLSQLYALRYGTLPVVRKVGGPADTVTDAEGEALRIDAATGFLFDGPTARAMLSVLDRALALYRQPIAWRKLQHQAMRKDFGWDASASHYLALYRRLAREGAAADAVERNETEFASAAE